MHQNNSMLTLTDLTTIFHVTKSSLRSHLEAHNLIQELKRDGHAKKNNYRYTFDDIAMLELAYTFKGKKSNRKSKSSKQSISNVQAKSILKKIDNVNNKLDLIINKLHISY